MTDFFFWALAAIAIGWGVTRWLRGADMRQWDDAAATAAAAAAHRHFAARADGQSSEQQAVLAVLGRMMGEIENVPFSKRIERMRASMDSLTIGRQFDCRFVATTAAGVAAEWVLAPGADPARRTLYIHGGAYTAGSPLSHRSITARFAELTRGAVLAIDYRLMPEHPRRAGIADCRSAYRWLIDNGPDGAAPATALFVAGDSAGGNLTLSLIAWVRDQRLRAPDAAVALSPSTDSTLGSPSLRANLATDPMLGPVFRHLARLPRFALLWGSWLQTRIRPADPVVSPLLGDLAHLPALLIQASSAEMLIDDARRYANKARAAGSPVRLQTWSHMVHVWQIFDPQLPEAREAFEQIGAFLDAAAPAGRAAPAVAVEATMR